MLFHPCGNGSTLRTMIFLTSIGGDRILQNSSFFPMALKETHQGRTCAEWQKYFTAGVLTSLRGTIADAAKNSTGRCVFITVGPPMTWIPLSITLPDPIKKFSWSDSVWLAI